VTSRGSWTSSERVVACMRRYSHARRLTANRPAIRGRSGGTCLMSTAMCSWSQRRAAVMGRSFHNVSGEKPVGRCGKPATWSVRRFSKPLWTRGVRPQRRHRPPAVLSHTVRRLFRWSSPTDLAARAEARAGGRSLRLSEQLGRARGCKRPGAGLGTRCPGTYATPRRARTAHSRAIFIESRGIS
jgi:hypothetical protein